MKARICMASTLVVMLAAAARVDAQSAVKKPASLAQLELTMEVATTNDDGNPQALRVTVKNVGSVVVTMPLLNSGCHPDNGVWVRSAWVSADEKRGSGGGGGCGIGDQPTLVERATRSWIRLRPGEYMTTMLEIRSSVKEPGTVDYWVEYVPPDAKAHEIEELLRAGHEIPTEKMETEHRSFVIR